MFDVRAATGVQSVPESVPVSAEDLHMRTSAFSSGADYIQALLENYSWTGSFNRAVTVDYTFDASSYGGTQVQLDTQRAAILAMQEWSNVANISFVAGDSGSALRYSANDLSQAIDGGAAGVTYTLTSGTTITTSEIQIDYDYTAEQLAKGKYGYFAMLHEVGHAIGLKHPFDEDSGNGTTLDGDLDSWNHSIMSYTEGAQVDQNHLAITPMTFDIAAAQYLYGANYNYHAGNDSYIITGKDSLAYTIWDGGGSDSIIAGAGGKAVLIDLTDTYDFDNEFRSEDRSPGLSKIGNTVFYTAFGSNIEYAKGDSGNDTIDGNDNANTLVGAGGNDILDGWDNNDTIYGGQAVADANDGNDLIRGDLGQDLIYGNTGNDTIFGGGGLYSETEYDLSSTERTGTKIEDFTTLTTFSINNIYQDDTDGADTIYGGYGKDVIYGNGGNDKLYGGGAAGDPNDGADTIIGGRGKDTLIGNGGDDLIIGGHGYADTLDDNDDIYGGYGNDTIYGNAGADVIWGGPGNDYLNGGSGNDLYVFYHASGVDSIVQFQNPGIQEGDTIYIYEYINGTTIATAQDVLSHITYSGTRAEIDLGAGNKVSVYGLGTAQLTADDFFVFGL